MVRKKYTAAWTVLTHRDVCYQPKRLSMTKTVITIRQQEHKKKKKELFDFFNKYGKNGIKINIGL